jgi:hypothetical protein
MDNCTEIDVYEFNYNNWINAQLLLGGVVIITSFTNLSLFYSIKKQIININNQIKNNLIPPLYKVES